MATEVALNPEVPKYNQDEFNNAIEYNNVTADRKEDCVPVSVGMVFGYFWLKYEATSNYDLIPTLPYPLDPAYPNGDLSSWVNNPHGIKRLIEYQDCELDDPNTCGSENASLSEWVNYSYGQLEKDGEPYIGTLSGDLCHKIRQAFSEYDSSFSLTVSYDELNTGIDNKDEIVSRIKSEIDNGNPVMFYGMPGMKFWYITSTTPTPSTAPTSEYKTLTGGHAMVITAYNEDIFRLNFGYDDNGVEPYREPEIIVDAGDNFGFYSSQGMCAEVYFFTMGENNEVGLDSNDEWVSSGDAASINFVNAYVKFDGENTIGDVTSSVYQKSGTDMYVQEFEDASFNETYIICEWRDNWYHVYPVTGNKLTYWLSNYSTIGHPEGMPFNAYDEDGTLINVQKFAIGSGANVVFTYIGNEEGSSIVSEYSNYKEISSLHAKAISDTSIELVWEGTGDTSDSYRIYGKEASGNTYNLLATVNGMNYIHTGLTADTSYDYYVIYYSNNECSNKIENSVTTFTSGNNFYPTPVSSYPTFGDVNFQNGYYLPYGYDVANSSIVSLSPIYPYEDIWKLSVDGIDPKPGIGCAITPKGCPIDQIMIEFRARITNGAHPFTVESGVIVCDHSGNPYTQWNHVAPLTPLFNPLAYQDGEFFTYRVHFANLLDAVTYLPNSEGYFKQFAIALTEGSTGAGELWDFDWIRVYISGVDFVDNYAMWYDCDDVTTDTYSDGNRVMLPSGPRPSIVSAGLVPLDSIYTKIGMKFSIANTEQEVVRVFFDIGSGFSNAPFVTGIIDHSSGEEQTMILDIPFSAIANVKGVAVQFFDNDSYQGKTIYVDDMVFLVDDNDALSFNEYPVKTVSDYFNE
jgi:hypothetical protein